MDDINLVKDLLGQMDPGVPKTEGALTLVPLFAAAPAKDYLLASDAFAGGLLTIEEMGHGAVPTIVAHNQAELPVLLLDGEHLEGAKQNRILNVTALIAAKSDTTLPVSCVEQGRWSQSFGQFSLAPDHAYGRLRRMQAEESVMAARTGRARQPDQRRVWQEVASKQREVGVASATGAMKDAFDGHRHRLDSMRRRFEHPEPGQTGVLACVGGRPVVLDVFDRPETLAKIWPRLVSGYAMDAMTVKAQPMSSALAMQFVADARNGQMTSHEAVGMGSDVVLTGTSVVGNALTWDVGVVHLALFARSSDEYRPYGGRIASPRSRQRMRRYFHAE